MDGGGDLPSNREDAEKMRDGGHSINMINLSNN
jgi:hypothetical protein